MGRGVQEGTTGVMRVTLCMCTVRMCGTWGCRGASGVPASLLPQRVLVALLLLLLSRFSRV